MRLLVVPGSARVRLQAESEGLTRVFLDAGAEWRGAGCSMCLAMNPDKLAPGSAAPRPPTETLKDDKGPGAHPPGFSRSCRATAVPAPVVTRRPREVCIMEAFTFTSGTAAPLAPQQCRYRSDHSRRSTSSALPVTVSRTLYSASWRKDPEFVLNRDQYPRGLDPGSRSRFRDRLLPRARCLGASGLRIQSSAELTLRRHLSRKFRQRADSSRLLFRKVGLRLCGKSLSQIRKLLSPLICGSDLFLQATSVANLKSMTTSGGAYLKVWTILD